MSSPPKPSPVQPHLGSPPSSVQPTVTAFRLFETSFGIHPAPRHRAWMNATDERYAYRCLPLVMANQAGWILTSGRTVVARWSGGPGCDDLTIVSPGNENPPASSQFGYGILTWEIPFIFRTSPGYNLLARGPANWWKDGAVALEGLVETDWAVATFTMNWKIIRPGHEVRFDPADPICMLVPQRRGELESFQPSLADLGDHSDLQYQFREWENSRNRTLADLEDPARPPGLPTEWQLHYLRGTSPGGAGAREHQTKLQLREFIEDGRAQAPGR
ncbi:MAG: DUF6065 family protein [Gemmatimonadales bacterium]